MLLPTLALTLALAAPEAQIDWYAGPFMSAQGVAREAEQSVLIYFWSDQSKQCGKLYQETLMNEKLASATEDFVVFSANTGEDAGYKLVERFHVTTLPTLLVVSPDGQVEDAILGYIGVEGLVDELARIERGEGTVSALRTAATQNPKDLEARYTYAIKLSDVGDKDGFKAERAGIYAADPKSRELVTSRLHLFELREGAYASEEEAKTCDLKPMKDFLAKNEHAEVLYEGWSWVAGMASYQEDLEAARSAQMTRWEYVPESAAAKVGFEITNEFCEQREELDRAEKKFALRVAKQSLESVELWQDAEGCGEGCRCGGCTSGCVGDKWDSELKPKQLYLARSYDTLARAYSLNGKRKDALAANAKSLELAPESEQFTARREELKKRS